MKTTYRTGWLTTPVLRSLSSRIALIVTCALKMEFAGFSGMLLNLYISVYSVFQDVLQM
jgi:hypothetical protein